MANNCNSIPESTLNSGVAIPLVGFGTAAYPFKPENVKEAVVKAIDLGYRHFDTAALYQTEKPVGEAIKEAIKLGLIKSRQELFITSKLWCSDAHPQLVLPALQTSLRNLGLEYLDLYLIHWPMSSKPGEYEIFMEKEDMMAIDLGGVWEAMEESQKLGLAKSIGVSNFSCKKLQDLLDLAAIPPAVNQVEMNPFWQQKQLREFCKEKGVHISAYSPLGANGSPWGTSLVINSDVIHNIALSKGKSVAQVCLRWAYEQGVSVLVKSFNQERMRQNLDIFDWNLSEEENLQIQKIPQARGFPYTHITGDGTPYKTLEHLWDGEI
ncbi:hypothetical protein V2J09_001454 [Rumex salicifolius]